MLQLLSRKILFILHWNTQKNGASVLLSLYQKIQVLRNNTDKNYFAIIVIKKSYVRTVHIY